MIVARKKFLFDGKQYLPGATIKKGTLDKYQEETFLRTGFVVEKDDPKPKPKMVEVKAEVDELVV